MAYSDTDFHRAVYEPSQAHLGFITFNSTAGLPGLNIAEEMVKLIPTQI